MVTNSSPLCYLVLIDQIQLMQVIFNEILVPAAVICELADKGTPSAVRDWIAQPPGWLKIRKVGGESAPQLDPLHIGKRDALILARQIKADLVVLDEKLARRIAREQGLGLFRRTDRSLP